MAKRSASTGNEWAAARTSVVSLGDYEGTPRQRGSAAVHETARRAAPADPFRVLAVLDGTRESSRLLDYLLGLKPGSGTMEVLMIHCHRPVLWKQVGPLAAGHRNALSAMTKRSCQFASRRLAAAQIKQSHRMMIGDPVEMMIKCLYNQRFSMILVAGHHYGSRRNRLLSRVGLSLDALPSRLMRRTDVPICVIR